MKTIRETIQYNNLNLEKNIESKVKELLDKVEKEQAWLSIRVETKDDNIAFKDWVT